MTTGTADREIVIERVIDAPREKVFKAWTTAEHLAAWFGPDGFTITTSRFEFTPGGVWRFVMHGPDGTDYENRIVWETITPPERITYRHDDPEAGDIEPVIFDQTVTFEDVAGKTKVTLHAIFPTKAARDRVVDEFGAIEGGHQTLGRLAAIVEG